MYNLSMDPAIIDTILDRLAAGEPLNAICRTPGYPSPQLFRFHVVDDTALASRYARARNVGLDHQAEQIVEIAQDDKRDPNARRVEIDARKWLLSKMRPDKYGDRVTQEVTGPAGAPLQLGITLRRVDKPEPL